jgi:uncharacterized membrane protein
MFRFIVFAFLVLVGALAGNVLWPLYGFLIGFIGGAVIGASVLSMMASPSRRRKSRFNHQK